MTYVSRALVKNIRERLVEVARARETVTYLTVAQWAGFSTADGEAFEPLRALLSRISTEEHDAGRPLLTVVVVRAHDGIPGNGFFRLARRLKRTDGSPTDRHFFRIEETARVYSCWASQPQPAAPPPTEVG